MRRLFLVVLSGLTLAFSWPHIGFFPFIFFAFIPLLILENQAKNGREIFFLSFCSFFIFNIITTYWVWYASNLGALFAFFLNSVLMSFVFYLYFYVKRKIINKLGYYSLIFLWISMEYMHLNWDLSWPWLTLGNVFATYPILVNWYEYTGFLGGSFWILLVNLLVYKIFQKQQVKTNFILLFISILLPISISLYINYSYSENIRDEMNVLVVQPNIEPYTEKFTIPSNVQLFEFIKLVEQNIDQKTDLILGPETVLSGPPMDEDNLESIYQIKVFRNLQEKYPNLNIIVGAITKKNYKTDTKITSTARFKNNEYYDLYNSLILIPTKGNIKLYHKSKLVPGAEKMPFPVLLDPIAKMVVNLGGISGTLGNPNYTKPFIINGHIVTPLICYESVYGDMQTENSDLLAIATNDGWWKNTAGYKQHFDYSKLRAIEQRKWVIRSANTGISAIINAKGEAILKTNWDECTTVKHKININKNITFYKKYGDYLGRIFIFLSFILIISTFVKSRVKK
tara:strand:+ start:5755 stop:7287 length:1533 start_codon:yes stop_codon:yes gene_type:complete